MMVLFWQEKLGGQESILQVLPYNTDAFILQHTKLMISPLHYTKQVFLVLLQPTIPNPPLSFVSRLWHQEDSPSFVVLSAQLVKY